MVRSFEHNHYGIHLRAPTKLGSAVTVEEWYGVVLVGIADGLFESYEDLKAEIKFAAEKGPFSAKRIFLLSDSSPRFIGGVHSIHPGRRVLWNTVSALLDYDSEDFQFWHFDEGAAIG